MSAEAQVTGGNDGDDDEEGKIATTSARRAAASYAWEYFRYHARQRQEVFRFYIIIVGALIAGDISSADVFQNHRYVFGLVLLVLSILFKRLDQRSHRLIKLAEAYLKIEEQCLSTELPFRKEDNDKIKILTGSDSPANRGRILASFRQIYTVIFVLGGFIGLLMCYREGLLEELRVLVQYFCK
jgi:hypothetical protein